MPRKCTVTARKSILCSTQGIGADDILISVDQIRDLLKTLVIAA